MTNNENAGSSIFGEKPKAKAKSKKKKNDAVPKQSLEEKELAELAALDRLHCWNHTFFRI